jgi:TonB family protein
MRPTDNDIDKYRKGKLTPAERHALEKKALSDPFLADALEGSDQVTPAEFEADLKRIKGKIRPQKAVVFTPLRIAAGMLILVAAAWSTLYLLNTSQPELASSEKQLQQPPAAKDSASGGETPARTEQQLSLKKENTGAENKPKNERQQRPSTTGPDLAAQGGRTGVPAEVVIPDTETLVAADEALEDDLAAVPDTTRIREAPSLAGALKAEEESRTQAAASERAEQRDSRTKRAASERQADMIMSEDAKMSKADAAGAKAPQFTIGPVITGKVTLADDGLPVPGVNVSVKGSNQGTVTDLNGAYSLQVDQPNPTLVFSFIGLQTHEAVPGSDTLDVKLAEDVSQLSEVVVTGRAVPADLSGEPVVILAEPVGGLRAYDKYLDDNLRYPQQALDNNIKGRVAVQFTVGLDGALGEFKVTRSLGFGCDEEVIRLVKEGPAWRPSTENNVPIESLVRVRLRFDPAKRK